MALIVSSWIYIAPKGSVSLHPQIGSEIGSQHIQNFYWRSLVCLMASVKTFNPESRRIIFSNVTKMPVIDGVNVADSLAKLNVELVVLDHLSIPPAGFYGAWGTQFIVLDCVESLVRLSSPGDEILLLDSDCLFNQPIGPDFISSIHRYRCMRYDLDDGKDSQANGLTWQDLGKLAGEYNPPLDKEFIRYAGGEIIAGTHEALTEVAMLARPAYDLSVSRHLQGLPKFNEEAHLLSYVYEVMSVAEETANPYIKRIWTDRGIFCNVDGTEDQFVILHLPSEKKTGFVNAFRRLASQPDLFRNRTVIWRLFNLSPTLLSLARMWAMSMARPYYHQLRRLRQALKKNCLQPCQDLPSSEPDATDKNITNRF